MKLTKEDFYEIARLVDKGYSDVKIAQLYNVGKTNMNNLVRRYKKHGIEAITCKGNWRNFTETYKLEVINRHYKGESISSLAIDCNVTNSVIQLWIKKYEQLGLFAVQGKNGKYHSYKGDNGELKENLLLEKVVNEEKHKTTFVRRFETTRPNQKWTTDVSEFKHKDGKLYLSPILDMFDSSIIAYDISTTPDFEQTKRMLSKAFNENTNLDGLIFHSDQGWQYQMKYYKQMLQEKQIKQSFSRKGNCMDNSLMENFFGIIKNEMFYDHEEEFDTIDDLRLAIENYIKWYNEDRINVKRKGLSPLQYRQQSFLNL